ncbi:MAG: cytochrome P450 [Polyangiaceae bacterium]
MAVSSVDAIRPIQARDPLRIPGSPLSHLREFRSDRTALQIRIARAHPHVAAMRVGLFDSLLVNAPNVAQEVLQTQADSFFKSLGLSLFLRPLLGDGLLTSERDFHARQRRLIAPALSHKRIASYADTMAERASRAVSTWKEGETFDALEAMMRLTLEIVGKTLFDAEVGSDAGAVGDAITEVMHHTMASLGALIPMPPMIPTRHNLASRRGRKKLDAIIYGLIEERKNRPAGVEGTDLLSLLLAARDEDGSKMSDKQVRDESMTLFLAGHETTANALTWTLYLLARHPEVRARAEQEAAPFARRGTPLTMDDLKSLPYTLAVLKESMRLYPPAYIIGRRALKDVYVPGERPGATCRIEKNKLVFINVLGIQRRPDLFPDPDKFDPTRFLGDKEKELPRCAYLPFGAGPRICIGNHFALMEGHLLLATIVGAARLDLAPGQGEVRMEPLVTLRPRGGVRMRVSRVPAPS